MVLVNKTRAIYFLPAAPRNPGAHSQFFMMIRAPLIGCLAALMFGRLMPAYAASPTLAPAAAGLVIGEVGWAGSSTNTADEYIELVNLSNDMLVLDGIVLEGAATSGGDLSIPDGRTLAPGGVFLITNFDAADSHSAIAAHSDFVTSEISLSNSALSIVLRSANGTELDRAGNGKVPLAGSSNPITSMVRADALVDGSTKDAWKSSTTSSGFKGGVLDLGTPGTTDLTVVVPEPEVVELPAAEEPSIEIELPHPPQPDIPPLEEVPLTIEVPMPDPEILADAEVGNPTSATTPDPSLAKEGSAPNDGEERVQDDVEPEPIVESSASLSNTPPGTLLINEILSSPAKGGVEFVEILNPYNNVIPLTGWHIREGSGSLTSLPDQLLGFGQFALISPISGSLNNATETVELLDQTRSVIDQISYGSVEVPAPKKGESLVRGDDGVFRRTTTPTPKETNLFTEPFVVKKKTATTVNTVVEGLEGLGSSAGLGGTVPTTAVQTFPAVIPPTDLTALTDLTAPILHTLRLSEIYANTLGGDLTEEFIEIENTGTESVSLLGWILTDASKKKFVVKEAVTLGAGERYVFNRPATSIALNNEGDTVLLTAPDGVETDRYAYPKTKKGLSISRIDGVWQTDTPPTPDEANIHAVAAVPSEKSVAKKKTTAIVSVATTIDQALEHKDGTRVRIEGSVTGLSTSLGKQFISVKDEQGSLLVYKNNGAFPELAIGDRVRVAGYLSRSKNERRLVVDAKGSIARLSEGTSPTPVPYSADQTEGSVITLAGLFVHAGGKTQVATEAESVTIRMPSDLPQPAEGARVELTGILRRTETSTRVDATALNIIPEPIAAPAEAVPPPPRRTAGIFLTLAVIASLLFFAVKHYLIPILSRYVSSSPLRTSS